ncbi:hypothetical protein SCH01S_01_00240 [Sphingomonas changbaiensis NBRC 104936]|uniref:Uncharacterized protein n=1 Tax=Sphingomonas changbaiensis NBRC 104936 TaxID=1219043 RepID=A0A0E9MKB7_9SPHN|nr:nidogen-like domain-containing protein [Sphingomonas changbaiensis]GAO37861.1 hypothetical protein SCH01S_01_00240 [Sphingomonas changbaiensis NBRC 104936]
MAHKLIMSRAIFAAALTGWPLFPALSVSGILPANDDGSTNLLQIDFDFTFYGQTYHSLYVNNNGNVTFSAPLSVFTPNAFPSAGPAIIAPFWADVDTRNGKGIVSYSGDANAFNVSWSRVGYYDATRVGNVDTRNTFSLSLQRNNGILFQYGLMNWTTGDASGGSGGFGGTPATLGINAGDGRQAQVLARYSGPNVSDLDGTRWYFQTDSAQLTTPLFKQFNAPWGAQHTLNSVSDIMTQTGCFVTSTAMVLNAIGHNVDPGQLNTFLRSYMVGGNLSYASMPQALAYGQTDGTLGPPVRFSSTQISNSVGFDYAKLADLIDKDGPVILRVPSRNHGEFNYGPEVHAVVAWKVDTATNTIYIRDPGWSTSPGTLGEYVDYVNAYVRAQGHPEWQLKNADGTVSGRDLSFFFRASNGGAFSTNRATFVDVLTPFKKQIIQGSVNSPIELVITDPKGRRLGYDPQSAMFYNDIPDSEYFREGVATDASDDSQPLLGRLGPISFFIGDFLPGEYTFQLFGIANGDWSLDFGVSDPLRGFNPFQFTKSGQAQAGFQATFTFNVPASGPAAVPEPFSWAMMTAGFALAGACARRRVLRPYRGCFGVQPGKY